MDLLHHVYALIFGGELHLAPLKDPKNVLDLGTGTGIWAIDFADQYPAAAILGRQDLISLVEEAKSRLNLLLL